MWYWINFSTMLSIFLRQSYDTEYVYISPVDLYHQWFRNSIMALDSIQLFYLYPCDTVCMMVHYYYLWNCINASYHIISCYLYHINLDIIAIYDITLILSLIVHWQYNTSALSRNTNSMCILQEAALNMEGCRESHQQDDNRCPFTGKSTVPGGGCQRRQSLDTQRFRNTFYYMFTS